MPAPRVIVLGGPNGALQPGQRLPTSCIASTGTKKFYVNRSVSPDQEFT
jgi:hypothetical protein